MAAWRELNLSEHNAVWGQFDAYFAFRPSVNPRDFPSITEPHPSVTYALSRIHGEPWLPTAADIANLHVRMLAAFRACAPTGGWMYALDWQHASYWLDPRAEFDWWPIPLVPDGDYYAFLSRDFSWGTFSHPWEQTICTFGEPLLRAIELDRPRLLHSPIRRTCG